MTHNRKILLWLGAPVLAIFGFITSLLVLVTQPVYSFANSNKNLDVVNPNDLRAHVEFLADGKHFRNYQRLDDLNRVADYIHKQFDSTGGRVEEQKYKIDDQEFRNVIVRFGPLTGELIIVGAHYDSYDGTPGADDNASGVAGLIELAKLIGKEKPATTVEMVAYTLEEPPFFRGKEMGSKIHADRLNQSGTKVKAMICLEMIGYYTDSPNSQEFPLPAMSAIYPSTGNFIAIIGSMKDGDRALVSQVKKSMTVPEGQGVPVYSMNAPASVPGIDFSDHLNYWAYGWNAVMISDTSFYRNKQYHDRGDTSDRLDYKRMAIVVGQIYTAIKDLMQNP